jgi:hypothetical protein
VRAVDGEALILYFLNMTEERFNFMEIWAKHLPEEMKEGWNDMVARQEEQFEALIQGVKKW